MTVIAVTGDGATTTAVSLAAGWPTEAILIEADPAGGDLAAWFDVPPTFTDLVTRADGVAGWEQHVQLAANGLQVVAGAPRAREAVRSVAESDPIARLLAASEATTAIVDVGRIDPATVWNPLLIVADVLVMVHRQAQQSARAAAVRLQRLADDVASLAHLACRQRVVAVIGPRPYGPDEIGRLVSADGDEIPVIALPDDPLAAAVFAGRDGVSARRLARLPLSRAGRDLAGFLDALPTEGGQVPGDAR